MRNMVVNQQKFDDGVVHVCFSPSLVVFNPC